MDNKLARVESESRKDVRIKCPSCGADGVGSVHMEGIVEEITKAMEEARADENERLARHFENSGWKEVARGIRSLSTSTGEGK